MPKLIYSGSGGVWLPEQNGFVRKGDVTRDLPQHIYDDLVARPDFSPQKAAKKKSTSKKKGS